MMSQIDKFTAAFTRFRSAYDNLLRLLDGYPPGKQEQSGACGEWSAKQVVAHLSGWLVEAQRRYHDFDLGVMGDQRYDDDAFNAESVEERAHLTWDETLLELQVLVHRFLTQAATVPIDKTASDGRYQEWLVGLTEDCVEHTDQLRKFATARG